MSLQMNLSGIKGDVAETKSERFKRVSPGRGLCKFVSFEEYGSKDGNNHVLTIEPVAWTDPACRAVQHKETVFAPRDNDETAEFVRLCIRIAVHSGMVTADEIKAIQESGGDINFDFTNGLPGRYAFIEIAERTAKNGKTYTNIADGGFAIWHIHHPAVQDAQKWPTNPGVIQKFGEICGQWQATEAAVSEAKPTDQQPASNPFAAKV